MQKGNQAEGGLSVIEKSSPFGKKLFVPPLETS